MKTSEEILEHVKQRYEEYRKKYNPREWDSDQPNISYPMNAYKNLLDFIES